MNARIRATTPEENARLRHKLFNANMWMNNNPFAAAMREKVRYYMNRRDSQTALILPHPTKR